MAPSTEQLMLDLIAQLNEKLDKHIEDSTQYRESIAAKIIGDEKLLAAFQNAFPDGDPHSHRVYHEMLMEKLKEEAELRSMLKKEILKWGLLGFLGFACVALWKAFLLGPK